MSSQDIEGLFLRRFKKDVQEQIGKAFLDRKTHRWPKRASVVEEQAFEPLTKASFVSFEKAQKTGQLLFRTVLAVSKWAMASSLLRVRPGITHWMEERCCFQDESGAGINCGTRTRYLTCMRRT